MIQKTLFRQAGATGAFRGCAPQITACAPLARIVFPQSEGSAPKESNKPGATGVHCRACAPQKLFVPLQREWIFVPGQKTRLKAMTEPKWAKSEIHTIRSRRAAPSQVTNVPPRARLVPRKKVNGHDEDLFF